VTVAWTRRDAAVLAPATSANLGPGFDAFGLALDLHDAVTARVLDAGLEIRLRGVGAETLPRDETHLVVRAMRATFDALGGQPPGLWLSCVNAIPHGRGLGSSAAAVCAGVLAARELVEGGAEQLDDDAVLRLAVELEGHPDNVAACLRGGFTVAWQGATGVRASRFDPAPELAAVLFVPQESLSTVVARSLLPERVPHQDAAFTAGRAGLLALAVTAPELAEDRDALLFTATDERLHQRYRAEAMPASAALLAGLRERGLAAVISGAGPSVLLLGTRDILARVLDDPVAPGWRRSVLPLAARGARADPVDPSWCPPSR
jgi:homoserine kinase